MKKLFVGLITITLAGCAGPQGMGAGYRPMVDLNRPNAGEYEKDVRECQQYAATQIGAGGAAVGGAAAGAVVTGLLSAILGGSKHMNWQNAALGATAGAAGAAGAAETNQRDIIRRCLAGRGHSVLN